MILPCIEIRWTDGAGRGVFTTEDLNKGKIIEISPVIVMSAQDRVYLDKTLLHDYIFEWGEDSKQCAMALGNIPMYNHSYKSNCDYNMVFEHSMMYIKTMRKIKAGEELTINYNGEWNDAKKVWFETRE